MCKQCKKVKARAYYQENKEKVLGYTKAYHEANRGRDNKKKGEWYQRNREALLAKRERYRQLNKDKIRACNVKRRAMKLKATIQLSDSHQAEIVGFYHFAKTMSTSSVKFHVDHIVPLKGELVCGLHVPWNLQVLTAEENLKKGNKHC
jgi:5-methylcytosine-specific restriction endonuclease McrA